MVKACFVAKVRKRPKSKMTREKKKTIKYLLKVFKSATTKISLRNVVFMREGITFVLTDFFFVRYHTLLTNRDAGTEWKHGTNEQNSIHALCVCAFFLCILKNLKFVFRLTNHVKFSLVG